MSVSGGTQVQFHVGHIPFACGPTATDDLCQASRRMPLVGFGQSSWVQSDLPETRCTIWAVGQHGREDDCL